MRKIVFFIILCTLLASCVEEQQTCYGNAPSAAIIQVGQASNTNSSLRNYMVRFSNKNDFKLSHRYNFKF